MNGSERASNMEVAFISNFLNHYQASFAESMRRKGITYWFLATKPVTQEYLELGFSGDFNRSDYVVNIGEEPDRAKEIIKRCDLLLTQYDANELRAV